MWYTASLLFESVHDGHSETDGLWEESLILVEAESEAAARSQAQALGTAAEHDYTSATGDHVQWKFRRVESVCAINATTLEHGTELFSRFLKASEVKSLATPFNDASAVSVQT